MLDRLAEQTGLEFVGWVLTPGRWAQYKVQMLWGRYVDLVAVEEENSVLRKKLELQNIRLARLEEKAVEADTLRQLLKIDAPEEWTLVGARVIAHQLGPNAVLESGVVDMGQRHGATPNTPVLTDVGVVGRIFRTSPHFSSLLFLSDPNSHIAVLGRTHRTGGILSGQGAGMPLALEYVPQNAPLEEGEILVTSGLASIFPKGVPVARVVNVERSDLSLFKNVIATPLVDVERLEAVLLLIDGNSTIADPTALTVQEE